MPLLPLTALRSAAIALAFLTAAGSASAAITTYTDRTAFNEAGTIAFNSNLDDRTLHFDYEPNPFTLGDVTYTSNLLANPMSFILGYSSPQFLLFGLENPILATVADGPAYDLLGFDAASFNSTIDVTVMTNLDTYYLSGIGVGNGYTPETGFAGFQATGTGEYITGFAIVGWIPGITNVAVGNATAVVPEPAGALLSAMGALALLRRRR